MIVDGVKVLRIVALQDQMRQEKGEGRMRTDRGERKKENNFGPVPNLL